jgi:hypothetical protein
MFHWILLSTVLGDMGLYEQWKLYIFVGHMESQYKKQPCVNLVHNAEQGFGYQMEKKPSGDGGEEISGYSINGNTTLWLSYL